MNVNKECAICAKDLGFEDYGEVKTDTDNRFMETLYQICPQCKKVYQDEYDIAIIRFYQRLRDLNETDRLMNKATNLTNRKQALRERIKKDEIQIQVYEEELSVLESVS